ncbi:hypothetical protein P7C65_08s1g12990 [Encephalitozoon intestinalis]
MLIFLCGEVASFNISIRDNKDVFFFVAGTQIFVIFLSFIFFNEEYVHQRRFLLGFSRLCTLGGIAYTVIYIVMASRSSEIRK